MYAGAPPSLGLLFNYFPFHCRDESNAALSMNEMDSAAHLAQASLIANNIYLCRNRPSTHRPTRTHIYSESQAPALAYKTYHSPSFRQAPPSSVVVETTVALWQGEHIALIAEY